jgi:hypothetical protein
MSYTDKSGYTIRFGGPEGIQWIKNEAPGTPMSVPTNAAGLIIEATKAAALIWQAWEMHRQTLVQVAQLEERRIPWLAEMLSQWSAEIGAGQARLDTATHFDREITRLLEKLVESKMMDVPSILLLQVERCAQGMSALNRLIAVELSQQKRSDPRLPELIEYLPYWEVDMDELSVENYLTKIDKSISVVEESLVGRVRGAIRAAVWHFSAWRSARAMAEKKQRLEEFRSLTGLAIELRSLKAQLSYTALLPPKEVFLLLSDSSASTMGS